MTSDAAPVPAARRRLAGLVAAALVAGVAITAGAVTAAAPAAATTAFTCAAGFYQVSTGSSQFYRFDVGANQFTGVGSAWTGSVNGIGYDTADNLVYGITGSSVVRIDSTGTYTNLGATSGASIGSVAAGDFYSGGLLVAPSSGNTWSSVDVATRVATAFALTSGAIGNAASATWGGFDLTVVGTKAYGLNNTTLYVVDLPTKKVASRTVSGPTTGSYGAAYSDASGNAYFYNNTDKKVFQFTATELAKVTGSATTPVGVLLGGAASTSSPTLGSPNDGASCALAVSPYAPAVTTGSASSVGAHGATLGGSVTANNSSTTTGFCWSTSPSLSPCTSVVASPGTVTGTAATAVSATLTGLAHGTTYYARAYGTNAVDTTNGGTFSFTTLPGTAQTITFDPMADMAVGDPDATPAVTADSGLDVTVASGTPSVCTVGGDAASGWTVTAVASGTCTLTATQAGDATYGAATPVVRSFTVTGGGGGPSTTPQTITFGQPADMTVGDPDAALTVSSDSGLDVTVTSDTSSVCTVGGDAGSGWTVAAVDAGTCTLTATQAGDSTYDPATPEQVSFTVAAAGGGGGGPSTTPQTITFGQPADMTVGDPDAALTVSSDSGLDVTVTSDTPSVCTVGGDAASGWTVAAADAGTCTLTATQAGDSTYDPATPEQVSFTVAAAGGGGGGGGGGAGADPVDDAATVDWDTDVLVDVLANDPEGASLDAVATAPEHGTAVLEGAAVRYTPDGTFAGSDSFTYTVVGSAVEATVAVDVTGPEAPTAVDDTATSAGHGADATVDVLDNDSGTSLTVVSLGTPSDGTVSEDAGVVTYTPDDAFKGTDSFTYTVEDVVGQQSTATVEVTVANAPPTVVVAAASATAGTTVVVPLTTHDPNGDPVTVTRGSLTGGSGPGGVVATVQAGPALRVVLTQAFTGVLTVPLTAHDGDGGTGSATLHLTVAPRPATGVTGTVVTDVFATAGLTTPTFVGGLPVSGVLSPKLDSRVTWTTSPTGSVTRYVVTVNGVVRCDVPAQPAGRSQSCTVGDLRLATGDVVRVRASGAGATTSAWASATLPATKRAAPRLVAVVYFAYDGHTLDARAKAVLAEVASQARTYGLRKVTFAGHTDSNGPDWYNLQLSERRADSVQAYMLHRYPDLTAASEAWGESKPLLPNVTVRNKAVNRRVEVYIS